jgi:hypothetical protein
VLKARLSWQGTKLVFSTERDDAWWWLMQNGDVNTARLLLAVLDDPAWKDDMGRLANGFIGRQQRGAWATTTANLWGGLALEKFSAKLEATPVTGSTRAALASGGAGVSSRLARSATGPLQRCLSPAATTAAALGRTAKDNLAVTHSGTGKPWLTLQSLAAVDLKAPFNAGYQIKRRRDAGGAGRTRQNSRGDVCASRWR